MNAHDLTGKTAFVSGAFGGLGLHFARVLAGHGARVALAGRRIELGRGVAAEIGAAVGPPADVRAYALDVTDGAGVVAALARIAAEVNDALENIGARRLQTVMEKLVEDISFTAEDRKGETLVIDKEFVEGQLAGIAKNADLSRYVL